MKVWVTRDNETGKKIIVSHEAPYQMYGILTQKQFKKQFNFTPRKGSCKQMNLTLKEIVE